MKEDDYLDIYALPGTKIRFTANGGYRMEKESAAKLLELGETYTVDHIERHQSCSYVYLREVPGKSFNTCLFQY